MRFLRPAPALALAALCACAPSPHTPPVEGQDEFTSAGVGNAGSNRSDGPEAAAGDAAGGSSQPRQVEEGDVFKLANDELYILNMYRGLQIVDVHQPEQPVLQGTSPILGQPVEMYLRDGYAYVIVSDYYTWWQQADGPAQPFHGSQVRVVDVRVPGQPVVVGGIDIDGAVSDTRIVGDVLYVVSNRWAWYSNPGSTDTTDELFVASIDLANPASPRLVERQTFPGSSNQIHVSPTTLYVASPESTNDWQHPRTDVTVVDIDDPHGHLATKGSFSVDGSVSDRFQLDEFQGTFRVVSHSGSWGQDGSQRLSVFDVGPQQQGLLSQLDLPNTGGLFATRFDADRAYLVTMVSKDPLDIIDLRDARHPVLTHSLVIPGLLHRIEPRGDRLLALGTDDRWSGVAASLFDVADPQRPALLSRVQVGGDSTSYSWSNANWDDKALRVLDADGMMLVPFSAWQQQDSNTYGRYVNGFQIVDFDRTQLTARGVVEQDGEVARLASHRQRLLSISDRVLQTVDATDRDHPQVKGRVELARDVNDFLVANGKALSLTTSGWWWDAQTVDLRVSTLSDPEAGSLAKVQIPFRATRLVADGSDVLVLGYPANWDGTLRAVRVGLADPAHPQLGQTVTIAPRQSSSLNEWLYFDTAVRVGPGRVAIPAWGSRQLDSQTWETVSSVLVVDLAGGSVERVELPGPMTGELFVVGSQLWTGHQETTAAANGHPMSHFYVDRIDLAGAAPQLLPKVNVPGTLVGTADGGQLLFTRDYQWTADGNVTHALAELRLQGNRAHLRQYLPLDEGLGRIVVDGRRLYATTQHWWWMGGVSGQSTGVTLRTYLSTDAQPLHEVSRQPVAGWMQLREAAGGHLFLGTGYYGGPWEYGMIEDVGMGGAAVPGGMYYAATNGLLVYSLTTADQPTWQQFVRTNGWVQGLGVDGNQLFVSGGIYGVQKVALAP